MEKIITLLDQSNVIEYTIDKEEYKIVYCMGGYSCYQLPKTIIFSQQTEEFVINYLKNLKIDDFTTLGYYHYNGRSSTPEEFIKVI
jgi:hypothetical protein